MPTPSWQSYELLATMQPLPLVRPLPTGYTPEGIEAFARIDQRIGTWYRARRTEIDGLYLFHYRDAIAEPSRMTQASVAFPPAPFFAEFLRLRYRPSGTDTEGTLASFRSEVLVPLTSGPAPVLKAWSTAEGYSARDDVGARYGDLEHGVDPTEIVVQILTANTELRFYLLDHPEFLPNHDITHLYLSTMALTLAQEAAAFRQCIARVDGWDARLRDRVEQAARRQG